MAGNMTQTIINYSNMQLSAKQQVFIDTALARKNIYLTEKAGTGKSFVVHEIVRLLNQRGKKVVTIAPTGVAANNIGGQTIHSLFSINPFGVSTFALDLKRPCFQKGQLYVALSRVTSPEGLRIII